MISASAELASEARLVPLSVGADLVVSVRDDGEGISEVLTEELRCENLKE